METDLITKVWDFVLLQGPTATLATLLIAVGAYGGWRIHMSGIRVGQKLRKDDDVEDNKL